MTPAWLGWIIYHLAPRLGYDAILWEIPLEVIYSLEHVHLWTEGANTQAKVNADGFFDRLKKIKQRFDDRQFK